MDNKTFKTKTGFCHVLPDQIFLTRDGIVGNISEVTVGNNIRRILLNYGVLSLFLFYRAFSTFQNGQTIIPLLYGGGGVFLIFRIFTSLNNSATPIIERNMIKEINLKKGILGLTRSRFEVIFEDDNGKFKKRLIMLPGSMTDGKNETETAIRIFSEEKLFDKK